MRPLGCDHTAIEYLRFQHGFEPLKDFIGLRPDTLCNYRCVSCHQVKGNSCLTDEIYMGTLERYGRARTIVSISGGEPLLSEKHFRRVVRLVRTSTKLGLYPVLFSNCHILDVRKVEILLEAGLQRLTTAFYGPDAATHDRFRGKVGSFEAQCRALDAFCSKKRESPGSFELIVSLVIFRENYMLLPQMIEMVGRRFPEIDRLEFFPIKEYSDLFLTREDVEFLRSRLMPEMRRVLSKYNFFSAERKMQEIFQDGADRGVYGALPSRCYSCVSSVYICGREGITYPCGHMADYAERYPSEAVTLGRAMEELDLDRVKVLPLHICEVLCGPMLKNHNRRTEKAIEILGVAPDLAAVLARPNYENTLMMRLHAEYIAMRGRAALYRQ